MNALIEQNIHNLTTLWSTVGQKHDSFFSFPDFEYAVVKNSQWPNRLWLKSELSDELLNEIKNQLATLSVKVTIPIWEVGPKTQESDLKRFHFHRLFQQAGMSLVPKQRVATNAMLNLKKVSSQQEALLWSETFTKSFGYTIHSDTLLTTCDHIDYYLVYKAQYAMGTLLLFSTNETLGVHSLGVIPEHRKQGIAYQLMAQVINLAINLEVDLVTLQASEMAKDMYLRLGFEEQFRITNYTLPR